MIYRTIVFLILNFGALALGSFFTSAGVPSEWYANLNKAPWTPPGWVFGAAWTTIMICFAIYMAHIWNKISNKKTLVLLFTVQLFLNIAWNPAFFYFHHIILGLIIITALTMLMGYFVFNYWSTLKLYSLLVLPYFLWLLIATSLNAYIFIKN